MRAGTRGRLARLEARHLSTLSLWGALPPHLRGDVTPQALEEAAREAPDSLRGDVRAVSLWAYLCGGEV